jgi:hypothetical protein
MIDGRTPMFYAFIDTPIATVEFYRASGVDSTSSYQNVVTSPLVLFTDQT